MVGILSGYNNSNKLLLINLLMVIYILYLWLNDIIIEGYYMGNHSVNVSSSLVLGFVLFVLTEIMLFFSLFWSYFHSALNPYYLVWPPIGIELINPWSIPLLNTFLLLYSGIISTYAHHSYINGNRSNTITGLIITIILGFIFFILQLYEYIHSTYDISDSVYGSSFFMTTGAHGLHIVVGVIFMTITLFRIYKFHNPIFLFDCTMIYWHFVDIVWIGLFILIYYMSY